MPKAKVLHERVAMNGMSTETVNIVVSNESVHAPSREHESMGVPRYWWSRAVARKACCLQCKTKAICSGSIKVIVERQREGLPDAGSRIAHLTLKVMGYSIEDKHRPRC